MVHADNSWSPALLNTIGRQLIFWCHVCWKSSRETRWLQQIVSAAWEFTTLQASSQWQLLTCISQELWFGTEPRACLTLSMEKQAWIVQVRPMITTACLRRSVKHISLLSLSSRSFDASGKAREEHRGNSLDKNMRRLVRMPAANHIDVLSSLPVFQAIIQHCSSFRSSTESVIFFFFVTPGNTQLGCANGASI